MARIEMEPPAIEKYRKPKARLTRNNRKEINSRGITVPSRKVQNYEPNVNDHALLLNSGTLPGSKPFNYKVKAKANQKASWNNYLKQRAQANALAKKKPNNTRNNKKNNNGTRKVLF